MERALIGDYEAIVAEILATLAPHNHPLAVELAQVPEQIRGYGHIKERNVTAAKAQEGKLLAAFRAATRSFCAFFFDWSGVSWIDWM